MSMPQPTNLHPHMLQVDAGPAQRAQNNRRIVHVSVPERVFNHAKAQAYLSGLPWPRFVELLLNAATPLCDKQVSASR